MCFTRSCMGSKSRTTRRTSCRISLHARGELLALVVGQRPVHLEVHHRLTVAGIATGEHALDASLRIADRADHRVQQPADDEVASQELFVDRVDQERRVVGAGLDHRTDRLVAVTLDRGVEHPHRRGVGALGVGEPERRRHHAEQRVRPRSQEILVAEPPQERLGERLQRLAPLVPGVRGDALPERVSTSWGSPAGDPSGVSVIESTNRHCGRSPTRCEGQRVQP